MKRVSGVVKASIQKALGPGFESQVPHNTCYYFSLPNPMQVAKAGLPCTFKYPGAMCLRLKSNGPKLDDHHAPGQPTRRQSLKSNRLERLMGQNC